MAGLHRRSGEVIMQKVESAVFATMLAICGAFTLFAVPLFPFA